MEKLASFINDGEMDAEMIHVESEHSAISAAVGSSAVGMRTFTATASQGLALMHEVLHAASGMRLPIVMPVANRALSAPINIWNDHQDSISARDTGWMQMYVESAQEAFDAVIQAFKIAEDKRVLLPMMVCLDGFTLSHVYEPVDMLDEEQVKSFVPDYNPDHAYLDPARPCTQGPIGFPNVFMELKKAEHESMLNALDVIKEVHDEFAEKFGRSHGNGLIELYKMEDAEYAVAGMGTVCGTARVVVDKLREEGMKVGLLKVRSYRPFPRDELVKTISHLKGLAVLDRNISMGQEGALYTEIEAVLGYGDTIVNGFIAGLGGRDIKPSHIEKALKSLDKKNQTEWLM